MSEQSESPFFPVPVRWFELPMNTARWGFVRPADLTAAPSDLPAGRRAAPAAASAETAEQPSNRDVGRILNAVA